MEIYYEGKSLQGKKGEVNQDGYLCRISVNEGYQHDFSLFAVADGVGGLSHGEIASSFLIDSLETFWKNMGVMIAKEEILLNEALVLRLMHMSLDLYKLGLRSQKMASTLSILLTIDNQYHLFHIGDSKILLFRDGELMQLTEDHEKTKTLSNGKIKRYLARSLGTDKEAVFDQATGELKKNDLFILGSDGLFKRTHPEYMEKEILGNKHEDLLLEALIESVLTAGEQDDITGIVIKVKKL